MINVEELLYEICEDENVFKSDYDLIENEVLDSFAFIELFARLEELGIEIQPTRIDRNLLRTSKSIKELIKKHEKK